MRCSVRDLLPHPSHKNKNVARVGRPICFCEMAATGPQVCNPSGLTAAGARLPPALSPLLGAPSRQSECRFRLFHIPLLLRTAARLC